MEIDCEAVGLRWVGRCVAVSGGMVVLALQLTVEFFARLQWTLRRQKQDLRKSDLDARVIASINHTRLYAACVPRGRRGETARCEAALPLALRRIVLDCATLTEVSRVTTFSSVNGHGAKPDEPRLGSGVKIPDDTFEGEDPLSDEVPQIVRGAFQRRSMLWWFPLPLRELTFTDSPQVLAENTGRYCTNRKFVGGAGGRP